MAEDQKAYQTLDYDRNFDDVYLRTVSLGIVDELNDRISWVNRFSTGDVTIRVKFRHSLTGDENYNNDAFIDDVPGELRTKGNIDETPRVSVVPSNWQIASSEFTNPDIRVIGEITDKGKVKRVTGKLKSIPMNITFSLKAILDSRADVYKYSQSFAEQLWPFRFFTYKYNNFLNRAVMIIPDSKGITIPTDINMTSQNRPEIDHSIEVKTYQPVLTDVQLNNKGRIRNSIDLKIYDLPGRVGFDPDADISGPYKGRNQGKPDGYYQQARQLDEKARKRGCK